MRMETVSKSLALLLMGVFLVAGNPAPVEAQVTVGSAGGVKPLTVSGVARRLAGTWIVQLDLTPFLVNTLGLDAERVETLLVYFDPFGSVQADSEHEDDKESTMRGTWKHIGGGLVSFGAAGFRYGEMNACGFVGVESPPGNCLLKLGGILGTNRDGTEIHGTVVLSVQGGGMEFVDANDLSFTGERMTTDFFPGANP